MRRIGPLSGLALTGIALATILAVYVGIRGYIRWRGTDADRNVSILPDDASEPLPEEEGGPEDGRALLSSSAPSSPPHPSSAISADSGTVRTSGSPATRRNPHVPATASGKARPAEAPAPQESADGSSEIDLSVVTEKGLTAVYGVVRIPGPPPAPVRHDAGHHPDTDACGMTSFPDESFEVSPEGGLKNVFVAFEDPHGIRTVGGIHAMALLDQRNCRFQPHLLAVRRGAKVSIRNSDPLAHNVNLQAMKNTAFNEVIRGGGALEIVFTEPEKISLTCSLHPWMQAWIVVTDSPHFAVTNGKGEFLLAGVPPGEHVLRFWHEKARAPAGPQPVRVEAGGLARVEVWMERR